jgi:hypothetical protein
MNITWSAEQVLSAFEGKFQDQFVRNIFDIHYNSVFNKLTKQNVRSIDTHTSQHDFILRDANNNLVAREYSRNNFEVNTQPLQQNNPESSTIFSATLSLHAIPLIYYENFRRSIIVCNRDTWFEFQLYIEGKTFFSRADTTFFDSKNFPYTEGNDFITRYFNIYNPITVFKSNYSKSLVNREHLYVRIYLFLHRDHYVYLQIYHISDHNDNNDFTHKFTFTIDYIPFTDAFKQKHTDLFNHLIMTKHDFSHMDRTRITPDTLIWDVVPPPQHIHDNMKNSIRRTLSYLSVKKKLNKDTAHKISTYPMFESQMHYTNGELKNLIENYMRVYQDKSSAGMDLPSTPRQKSARTSPRSASTSPKAARTSPRSASTSPRAARTSPRSASKSPRAARTSPRSASKSPRAARTSPRSASKSPRAARTSPR